MSYKIEINSFKKLTVQSNNMENTKIKDLPTKYYNSFVIAITAQRYNCGYKQIMLEYFQYSADQDASINLIKELTIADVLALNCISQYRGDVADLLNKAMKDLNENESTNSTSSVVLEVLKAFGAKPPPTIKEMLDVIMQTGDGKKAYENALALQARKLADFRKAQQTELDNWILSKYNKASDLSSEMEEAFQNEVKAGKATRSTMMNGMFSFG